MTTARSFGRGLEFDRAADSHPLLWSAFTLLAFDELERHINLQQLTTFAEDYLASLGYIFGPSAEQCLCPSGEAH